MADKANNKQHDEKKGKKTRDFCKLISQPSESEYGCHDSQ